MLEMVSWVVCSWWCMVRCELVELVIMCMMV